MKKHNRRTFIQQGLTSSAALLLTSLDGVASNYSYQGDKSKNDLFLFATNWGFQGSMDDFCAKAKKEGYNGVELWWPSKQKEQNDILNAVTKHGLELGLLCGVGESNAHEHQISLAKMLEEAVQLKTPKPFYINLHSGKDYFSFEDNCKMVEYSLQLSKKSGIPVYHETHRSRMMFAAPITKLYLQKYPELKLTLDISHWCTVHESMLDDQKETIEAAIQHTGHIHARVGYQEGPQVSDPRAPEWEYAVKAHLHCWDQVVAAKRSRNEPVTFLTEFGPPLYMHTLPYTLQPLSNQWEINVHMMQLLRKRYS